MCVLQLKHRIGFKKKERKNNDRMRMEEEMYVFFFSLVVKFVFVPCSR